MTSGTTPQNHEPYPAYPSTDLPHTDPLPRPETPETAPETTLPGNLAATAFSVAVKTGFAYRRRRPEAKTAAHNVG